MQPPKVQSGLMGATKSWSAKLICSCSILCSSSKPQLCTELFKIMVCKFREHAWRCYIYDQKNVVVGHGDYSSYASWFEKKSSLSEIRSSFSGNDLLTYMSSDGKKGRVEVYSLVS